MGNILDYIAWRGDLTLLDDPFNEVDNLILAELAYTRMEEIAPCLDQAETIRVRELCEAYERMGYKAYGNSNDAYPLLRAAADSNRFRNLQLGAYTNTVDTDRDIQFSAVIFCLPDGRTYVSYRGTDNTLVGWREDFTISYLSETPGQYEAVRYLERIAARTEGPLLVGGHSKGGNLAVYAAAFCSKSTGDRVQAVFSNDGPGFNRSVVDSPEYQDVLKKVNLIIPESSLIGILLSNKSERKIIDSSASGMQQHDPYTWQVKGPRFVEAPQTQTSQFLDETLRRWLDDLDDSQRQNLVNAIFDSVDASGAQTFTELKAKRWASYSAILKAIKEMDPALQKDVLATAQKLAAAGRDVLLQDAQNSWKEGLSQFLDQWGGQDKT